MQITEEVETDVSLELGVSSLHLQVPSSCSFPVAGDEKMEAQMAKDQTRLRGKGAVSKNHDVQSWKAEPRASEMTCHSTAGQSCQRRRSLAPVSPVLWSAFVIFENIIDCCILTNYEMLTCSYSHEKWEYFSS